MYVCIHPSIHPSIHLSNLSNQAVYLNLLSDLEMCLRHFQHLIFQKWSDNGVFCTFRLGNVLRAAAACNFSTSELPSCPNPTLKHNGVQFFDIFTSKSGPSPSFLTFWVWTALRAPAACNFRHLHLQKWSEAGVFCAFLTWKCALRQSGVKFFDIGTSKSVCFLYILTWKCPSRHNGLQFFISHPARWLRTRRFSEPTFRPSRPANHWKNTVFCDFPNISRTCMFFLLTLSLSLFYSSLLCFSSLHIVGSLASKLSLINNVAMNFF